LQELANAKGNILENKELLDSLNQTKQNSVTIVQSLDESVKLQTSLDAVSLAARNFAVCLWFQLLIHYSDWPELIKKQQAWKACGSQVQTSTSK